MPTIRYYFSNQSKTKRLVNQWDILAIFIIFGILFAFAWGAKQMATPYQLGESLPISLDPSYLPGYAVRTVLRMVIALCFSLLFTFTIGTWAAKSQRAERIIIPVIDILQAVPVLSFLSITIVGFIYLFPNSLLGPECASIFAIFTAQAWNMAMGFYQTLRAVPDDLKEAADMFHLSAWQRFWRVEVPFSMSGLLWNTMMSMSASWFFVVVSEAISVSDQHIRLPGIGSYIAVAINQANTRGVIYAIITMLIVILIYDQLIFRPLIAWSEKFKFEQLPGEKVARSWWIHLLQRTQLIRYGGELLAILGDNIVNFPLFNRRKNPIEKEITPKNAAKKTFLWQAVGLIILFAASLIVGYFIFNTLSLSQLFHVILLGSITSIRVIVLIILSSIIWIPIGVWIGMRPWATQLAQPLIQFAASFPANLLYPIVVMAIVRYHLNVEIWITPLMILGTQWYILFNVIAGAANLPKDLYQVADNFGVHGWQWWKRFALPGIFPYFITGAFTAAGGAWNASIVAEWVRWGNTVLHATGLGEYIQAATLAGNFHQLAVGTIVMCLFVLMFNRIVWRPLYLLAETRFKLH